MGSRSYIGFLEGSTVTYSYCHQGAYIDTLGYQLMDYFTRVDDAKALATGGGMHTIGDGEVDRYVDRNNPAETMSLEAFESIDLSVEISTESLFLYKHGEWRVKSRHTHDYFFTDRWHFLEEVVKDLRNKHRPREEMLEMMRDYAERDVEFFCGSDVLDVEVICGLFRDVRGVLIELTG